MERQKRTADGRKIEEMKDMFCTIKKRKTDWPKKRLTKSLQKNLARKDRDINVFRGTDQRKCDVQR